MYIPTWLIIIAIIAFWFYSSRKKTGNTNASEIQSSVENAEKYVSLLKKQIFELEHFDSPHFVDYQNAFDAMEINYLRLKQRFSNEPDKVLGIARDWCKYAEALNELKFARTILDVDMSDEAFDNFEESSKEPSIIKDEVEKKFKSLLGTDWLELPPDYFKRMKTMKEPDKEYRQKVGIGNDWWAYYQDSPNLFKLIEKREKVNKEWKEKQEKEKQEKEKQEKEKTKTLGKTENSIRSKFWKWLIQDSKDKNNSSKN